MLTTCPECQTTFRVTQEHLGLRRGLVRCGHCGVVFNAYDSLLAELVTPTQADVEAAQPGDATEPAPDGVTTPDMPSVEAAVTTPPAATTADTSVPPVSGELPQTAAEPVSPALETPESILLSELPTRRTSPPSPGFYLKLATAIFLTVTLFIQSALFLRAAIASALPATRPWLEVLCRPLACSVPLPRELDKTAIVASALEHDAENRARARLFLLLANRTPQPQTWPYIVLILTDVRDSPVAQRIFTPKEYLAPELSVAAGLAAGEEAEIRLDLDTGALAATGYTLDLAYP